MRTFFLLMLTAGAARAHPGHVTEAAGHDHWIAGAAVAAALALAAWQAVRALKKGKAARHAPRADAEDTSGERAGT